MRTVSLGNCRVADLKGCMFHSMKQKNELNNRKLRILLEQVTVSSAVYINIIDIQNGKKQKQSKKRRKKEVRVK
jgi:hypothetical protein